LSEQKQKMKMQEAQKALEQKDLKIHKEADCKDNKFKTKVLELEWRLRAPSTIEALKAKHNLHKLVLKELPVKEYENAVVSRGGARTVDDEEKDEYEKEDAMHAAVVEIGQRKHANLRNAGQQALPGDVEGRAPKRLPHHDHQSVLNVCGGQRAARW
jgi:hypothetical protein